MDFFHYYFLYNKRGDSIYSFKIMVFFFSLLYLKFQEYILNETVMTLIGRRLSLWLTDLGMHCLHMSHKSDAMHICFNFNGLFKMSEVRVVWKDSLCKLHLRR